eukprot:scaffold5296_cov28-Tisochrysis_lutea.AAC.2
MCDFCTDATLHCAQWCKGEKAVDHCEYDQCEGCSYCVPPFITAAEGAAIGGGGFVVISGILIVICLLQARRKRASAETARRGVQVLDLDRRSCKRTNGMPEPYMSGGPL